MMVKVCVKMPGQWVVAHTSYTILKPIYHCMLFFSIYLGFPQKWFKIKTGFNVTHAIKFPYTVVDSGLVSIRWEKNSAFFWCMLLNKTHFMFQNQVFLLAIKTNPKIQLFFLPFSSLRFFVLYQMFQIFFPKYKFLIPFITVIQLRFNLTSMCNYVHEKFILANYIQIVQLQKLDVRHLCGLCKNSFLFSNTILPFLIFLYKSLANCFLNSFSNDATLIKI